MNCIIINPSITQNVWDQFDPFFGSKAHIKDDSLEFQNAKGSGKIEYMRLNDGLQVYRFKIRLKETVLLRFISEGTSSLNFCYCTNGSAYQSFQLKDEYELLDKFKTCIVGYPQNGESIYKFPENQELHFVLISMNCDNNNQGNECIIKSQINQLLAPHHQNGKLFYRGSYNLKIADKIRQLEELEETGVVKRLLTEGIVKYILGLEIKQHGEDLALALNDLGTLRVSEMESIKDLTAFIDSNIHLKINLNMLKSRSGLSPKKLQEGFKLMHGRTVNDYIKKVRLNVAEHLIKTSELNISEVVYTVGLSSRSYFSRIFLEHYNMCPKDYKDQFGTVASA